MVKSLLLRISLAPMLVTVFFGPALPLAHAALVPTPDTLGAGGNTPIRSYRPDPRDTDDNGILDAYQDGLDGRWSAARDAAQKAGLAGTGDNGGGTAGDGSTQTPEQQEAAALAAILAANDDGIPPPDSDHDGFSDYEESFKHGQLPVDMNLAINPADNSAHPPAYRYAIVDLGSASNAIISKRNGWVLVQKNNGNRVWHFGKEYTATGRVLPAITKDGALLITVMTESTVVTDATGLTAGGDSFYRVNPVDGTPNGSYPVVGNGIHIQSSSSTTESGTDYGTPFYFSANNATFDTDTIFAQCDGNVPVIYGSMTGFNQTLWAFPGQQYSRKAGMTSVNLEGVSWPWWATNAEQDIVKATESTWVIPDVYFLFSMYAEEYRPVVSLEGYVAKGDCLSLGGGSNFFRVPMHIQSMGKNVAAGLMWGEPTFERMHDDWLDYDYAIYAMRGDPDIPGYMDISGTAYSFVPLLYPTPPQTERRTCYVNAPDDAKDQVIVAGHQLWKRKLNPDGSAAHSAAFASPEDIRHLIDFSEPWLDLNATGVSDDGFIVGVGKKLKSNVISNFTQHIEGEPRPVLLTNDNAGTAPTKTGGATYYGPASPEKCGLWDHDIAHYTPADYEDHAFMLIPLAIRTDANRDGKIADDGSDTIGSGIPWHFWVNDDSDYPGENADDVKGAIKGTVSEGIKTKDNQDIPGGINDSKNHDLAQVGGVRDLVDFFPTHIDAKVFIKSLDAAKVAFPSMGEFVWKLESTNCKVHAVLSNQEKDKVLNMQRTKLDSGFGPSLSTSPQFAVKSDLSSAFTLPTNFIGKMREGAGVLFSEGADRLKGYDLKRGALRLKLEVGGKEITSVRLPLSFSNIEAMYRRINLRESIRHDSAYAAHDPFKPGSFGTQSANPPNYPDRESGPPQKHFVMVHGYNVLSSEARGTMAEAFKRLFQSGFEARFSGVTWAGEESYIPIKAATPDYNANVVNAFRTAPHLKTAIDGLKALPNAGDIVIAAHSLGNMLVSAAIQDEQLQVSKYLMIDAAVPSEAYGDGESLSEMVNHGGGVTGIMADIGVQDNASDSIDWMNYDSRLWAANYHELAGTGDFRAQLTWKNRFPLVAAVGHNYYSSTEDVLTARGGNQGDYPGMAFEDARQWIWMGNEVWKGRLNGPVISIRMGGWMTNEDWLTESIAMFPRTVYDEISDGHSIFDSKVISAIHANEYSMVMFGEEPYQNEYMPGDPKVAFIRHPLFARFSSEKVTELHLPGAALNLHDPTFILWAGNAGQKLARANFLAYAVPALSFPTGGTAIGDWGAGGNTDMNVLGGAEWPRKLKRKWNSDPDALVSEWWHSDFLNVSYQHTWKLWDDFIVKGKLKGGLPAEAP